MSTALARGSVLLVYGPAAIVIRSGMVSVLGADAAPGRRVIVRRGKALPLQALRDSTLEIIKGEGAVALELLGSTIPESWIEAIEEISSGGLSPVVVLGDVDRGKNTFCIYLANTLLREGGSVALIDGDVGQGDIGPPACVSMAHPTYPVFDLFSLRPKATAFIGSTTPAGVQNRILEAVSKLLEEAKEEKPNLILVNTDGWVLGDDAVEYKLRIISSIAPQGVVGIQLEDELEPILSAAAFQGRRVFRVKSSGAARPRDRETRRNLREQCYRKFLADAVPRSFPLGHVKLEYTFLAYPEVEGAVRDKLSEPLKRLVLAYADAGRGLQVLVKGSAEEGIEDEMVLKVTQVVGRPIRIAGEEEVKGLLLGLMDGQGRFMGLGMFRGMDFERRILGVLTPCSEAPAIIRFGRIRLDEGFREIGFTQTLEP